MATTPQVTYAGYPFLMPTPQLQAEVDRLMPFAEFDEWKTPEWPPKGLGHLPVPPQPQSVPVVLGQLYWPRGATRHAVYYGLMDGSNWAKARGAGAGAPGSFGGIGSDFYSKLLTISDGGTSISVNMYMLAARPISQGMGGEELYLVTLVDDRYYWHTRQHYAPNTSTSQISADWPALFARIARLLFGDSHPGYANLVADTVPSAYPGPTWRFGVYYVNTAAWLDAAARQTNMRVVRSPFDGKVRVRTWRNALTDFNTRKAAYSGRKVMGGVMPSSDLCLHVPPSINCWYPSSGMGLDGQTITLTTATASEPLLTPLVGGQGDQQGRYVAEKMYFMPADLSAWNALALQAAIDWYGWHLADTDFALEGIVPWEPTGLEGAVIWEMSGDTCRTRIVRPRYDDDSVYNFFPPKPFHPATINSGPDANGLYTWTGDVLSPAGPSYTSGGPLGSSGIVNNAYRMPSNTSGIDAGNPPAVPGGQFVLMRESPSYPGFYEFTPWGGLQKCQFAIWRYTMVSGNLIETPHTVTITGRDLTVSVD